MRLWIDATYFIPGLIDCWCDNMKLSYDSISKELDDSSGVNIRVPFFGSVQSIETLDNRFGKSLSNYFGTVIANLEDIGYKRDVSLRAAPYDFRYAPSSCEGREYIDRTVKLIEQMYRENGDTPVVLMSHSLGGLYGLYLLNHQSQEWKDQYIRYVIRTRTRTGAHLLPHASNSIFTYNVFG